MTHGRRSRFRAPVWSLLLLGVQLAGPAATTLDARLAASSRDGAHVEAERKAPCRPHHSPAMCQLCRMLASARGPVTRQRAVLVAARVRWETASAEQRSRRVRRTFTLTTAPRAPPPPLA